MSRILIADDHEFLRAGLEAVLGSLGHIVAASVPDGDTALTAIEKSDPEIVILDIRMPGRTGVEVLQSLRAKGDRRPILLLAAEVDDRSLVAAIDAKVDGIVLKGESAGTLQQAIEAVVAGKRFIDIALMDRAFELVSQPPVRRALDALSPRDRIIVERAAAGLRNKQIAEELGISEGAVKIFLHRVYDRLGVSNRTELAQLVLRVTMSK
ncbi:response regulator transcription factor [Novosphingobium sp. G106]|uniref:response regulator n=1 Tax=Novosphingobium sp. G106 TaxID=2849500 RepID=UPI001C2D07A2|nr:response regulator transcription factor [Novosphingobium sp. G106]MBV1692595.1 response regulator transcription factor [Novosphingobium sp. G106]